MHQVAVLFSLAEKTNHGPVWPEPLLSNSTCVKALKIEVRKTGKSCITFSNFSKCIFFWNYPFGSDAMDFWKFRTKSGNPVILLSLNMKTPNFAEELNLAAEFEPKVNLTKLFLYNEGNGPDF